VDPSTRNAGSSTKGDGLYWSGLNAGKRSIFLDPLAHMDVTNRCGTQKVPLARNYDHVTSSPEGEGP